MKPLVAIGMTTVAAGNDRFVSHGCGNSEDGNFWGLGLEPQQWLSDLAAFKASLRAQGAEPWVLENVAMAFDQMAERIERLAR